MALIRTGTANIASVLAAFHRLGVEPEVTSSPEVVDRADIVVLPGVGAFGASMAEIEAAGLQDALRSRSSAGRPLLGVCVGLHLLCDGSAEGPGVAGLGAIPGTVTRFCGGSDVRVPHMGWAEVRPTDGSKWVRPGHAYFAHSYRLPDLPAGWQGAWSDHGGSFVAAVERGPLLALQLHPELSGAWGEDLLERWLRGV